MRRMSFALTERQLLDGTKTVTRRLGWAFLRPGDELLAVRKCMGLKRGERQHVLAKIRVKYVTREPLCIVTDADAGREGFPGMTGAEFVDMFCRHMNCTSFDEVTRIEFERVVLDG